MTMMGKLLARRNMVVLILQLDLLSLLDLFLLLPKDAPALTQLIIVRRLLPLVVSKLPVPMRY